MIMQNIGEILMAAGFLLVVAAVFISMKKAAVAEGGSPEFLEWS
jgi:hypothetical protein